MAYGSADISDDQALTRRFFGWLLRAEGLQWLQMAAAGVDNAVFGALFAANLSRFVADEPLTDEVTQESREAPPG